MTTALRLTTVLEPRGPAGAIVLTDAQVAEIGGGAKSVPVRVTVNGTTVALRISRMGGEFLVGFSRAVRQDTGVEIGDAITVDIVPDSGPREVVVPAELEAALAGDPAAASTYAGLAYTHRKEFARWVGEAKRQETRDRRAAEALAMLREGRTRS